MLRTTTPKVFSANAVTGTNTYYSSKTSLSGLVNLSYHLSWTGTTAGTFTVQVSNVASPAEDDDDDWIDLTLDDAITQPAGSAGKFGVDLSEVGFEWIRLKYVNASGTGTVTAIVKGKGR